MSQLVLNLIQNKSFYMLIHHNSIPEGLIPSRRKVVINEECPFILVPNPKLTFLNNTIKTILSHYRYSFKQKTTDDITLMGYTLPIICFQDIVLQKEAIIQFLAEISLGNLPIKEFVERRENMIRMFKAWNKILYDQLQERQILDSEAVLKKNNHTNKIFEELISISTQIVNKGYQRVFRSYEANQLNIESVFVTYLTDTILNQFSMKHTDFILRAYFNKQIDFSEDYKKIIEENQQGKLGENIVLLEGSGPQESQHPKVSTNKKWFAGLLTLATLIFLKWSK